MKQRYLLYFSMVLLVCLTTFCRGGYKTANPLSPEELQLGEIAAGLATESDEMLKQAPESIQQEFSEYVDLVNRFNNAAQRYGANSLRARDAFDKTRYQATQLDLKITQPEMPEFFQKWTEVRKKIDTIANRLGYRIGR